MTASRSARQRKAVAEAGPLATVRIDVDSQQQFVYKIGCSVCVVKDRAAWSAYRPGGDNGFMAAMDRWTFHLVEKHPGEDNGYLAAMDRWTFHLVEKHPDVEAPCLAYLPAAQERLQARRDAL